MLMDELQLLAGDNIALTKDIVINHPTLKDIKDVGIERYNTFLSVMTDVITDVADILWMEEKVWYEDIKSEWEFFIQKSLADGKTVNVRNVDSNGALIRVIPNCACISALYRNSLNYFLGKTGEYIALEQFNKNGTDIILVNIRTNGKHYYIDDDAFRFTKTNYDIMHQFLSEINWIDKDCNVIHGGNKRAKKYILENEYKARKRKEGKKQKHTISLSSIISALIAKGVNIDTIWKYPIYLVYDQYYRHVQLDNYYGTLDALHAGCLDTSKNPINWEKINWAAILNKEQAQS